MNRDKNSWRDLFPQTENVGIEMRWRVIRRGGEAFLILPAGPWLAARALTLYPAQTPRARLAKKALGFLLAIGVSIGERIAVSVDPRGAFAEFVQRIAQTKNLPALGILAGNPRAKGRRFIALIFRQNRPFAVVKAGLGSAAQELIEKETGILFSLRERGLPGVPKIIDSLPSGEVRALALPFIEGHIPNANDEIAPFLTRWIDSRANCRITDLAAWDCLRRRYTDDSRIAALDRQFRGREIHPALHHGDFAPWNIRVDRNTREWIALDWERGEMIGLPAWDWFHYVLQTAVLVKHETVSSLIATAESLLARADFLNYCGAARATGLERALLLAYLLHTVHVVKQSEGLDALEALLGALSKKWLVSES